MTTTPCIEIELISLRMASTAAPSPPSLSPRPTQRPADSAAASVTRTSSSARLRSSSSRLRRTGSVIPNSGMSLLRPLRRSARRAGGARHRDTVSHNGQVASHEPAGRVSRRTRDMVISMAVLLVPVFLLLGAYRIFFAGDAPIAVDASDTWATARHSAPYPVLQPDGVPAGWTVISASYSGAT